MFVTEILVTSLFLFENLLIGEKVSTKNITICQVRSIVGILFVRYIDECYYMENSYKLSKRV